MALFILAQWVGCNVGVCTWLIVCDAVLVIIRTNGHISVLSEIHILFPFHLILTSGPILIAKNHQMVVLS